MFFSLTSLLSAVALLAVGANAAAAAGPPAPPVFTATRVYNTLTDVAPFIVKATTTVVWTASPSTTFAQPTGPGF